MSDAFIHSIKKIVLENIENDKFGVTELASKMGLSRSQILRKVKSETGKSANQLIREIRLEESVKLIKKGEFTASEIAYRVGFSSPSYFNKCFLDAYGITPGDYKKKVEEEGFQNDVSLNPEPTSKKVKNSKAGVLIPFFIIIVIAGIWLLKPDLFKNNPDYAHTSIAVLPLEDYSANKDKEYLVDGITEAITLELARNQSIRVISRGSAMMFKDKKQLYANIARELNVDLLLEGSVLYDADSLRVVVQLIEPSPVEKHLWANNFDQKSTNILQIVQKISSEIANEINMVITPSEIQKKQNKVDPVAYDLYLKGRHIYNNQRTRYYSLLSAVDYLNQSIERAPNYALSYVTLAEAYIALNTIIGDNEARLQHRELARKAIDKAFEINQSLPEAWVTKGHIAGKFDWQWEKMKEFAEKGLELDPNNAQAHELLSSYYIVKGNYNKAVKEAQIADILDPLNPATSCLLGERYYIAGEFDKAINKYNEIIELFPNYGFALHLLGYAYLQKGNEEKAEESWHKLQLIMGNEGLANCFETSDFNDCIRYYVENAIKQEPRYCSNPVIISCAQTMINEFDGALQFLKIAIQYKNEDLPVMLAYPDFKVLYQNPEFLKLVKQVGIILHFPTLPNP